MATVEDLESSGAIQRIGVPLDGSKQTWRRLYGTNVFVEWLSTEAQSMTSSLGLDVEPIEQIDAMFNVFISGEQMEYSRQFRQLKPASEGIWELKSPDIRIFGWFLGRDCFLASFGADATFIKDHSLYTGYIGETARVRKALNCETCMCVYGSGYADVLSNCP